jgi:hypothetical protein
MQGKRVVLVGFAAIALIMAACDYPMYRGDSGHTGFNALENQISASNVSTLTEAYIGSLSGIPSSLVVAGGTVYVETTTNLYAFGLEGTSSCPGSPRHCQPLWTAPTPGGGGGLAGGAPAVTNGIVYVQTGSGINAYDAAGHTNCSGTPNVCQPLWEYFNAGSSPTVFNGVMYAASGSGGDAVVGFDAAGNQNCSGTPKVCQPIWTGSGSSSGASTPAVVNGVVYLANGTSLLAFDATGKTNCSGTPPVCSPLWSAPTGTTSAIATPAVGNGIAYIANDSTHTLYAFDATGTTNCSGSPKTCTPLWTASGVGGAPAIANGKVYIDAFGALITAIDVFNTTPTTNCSGTPTVCTPLWSYTAPNFSVNGDPVIANGVLYSTDANGNSAPGLHAWDATGTTNCSGTPTVCSPLFSFQSEAPSFGDPAVAFGMVYFADGDPVHSEQALFALKLP